MVMMVVMVYDDGDDDDDGSEKNKNTRICQPPREHKEAHKKYKPQQNKMRLHLRWSATPPSSSELC